MSYTTICIAISLTKDFRSLIDGTLYRLAGS